MAYLTPGIYMEEVSTGARPIEAVGTSTPGFVGEAPAAGAPVNEAVGIDNWSQFVTRFAAGAKEATPLAHAVFGFFQNGGGRCYVVNVGRGASIAGGSGAGRTGIDVLETLDDIAIVAAPGYTDAGSYDALLTHCEKLKDRIAILDAPEKVADIGQLKTVAVPKGQSAPPADPPAKPGLKPRQSAQGYGALYFPWLQARDPFNQDKLVSVPPSGHMAGIYARTDSTRGVHKAPANEVVRGALDLTYRVTREEQAELNPAGVNCIRMFPGEGILVWGARTLAPSASEWRYVNVRRLFNMIETSISRNTRWVVFEPNDSTLWKSIRRDISAFLRLLWRQGALRGRSAEEAFFVQCDEETNPTEVIDAGQVVTLIGVAPVKPAEFVIFRIGQSALGAEVE